MEKLTNQGVMDLANQLLLEDNGLLEDDVEVSFVSVFGEDRNNEGKCLPIRLRRVKEVLHLQEHYLEDDRDKG